jgi:hypothetical protein
MNAKYEYETPSRCSAAGVTTASMLVVILAMGASTLFSGESSAPITTTGTPSTQVAQTHAVPQVKKS